MTDKYEKAYKDIAELINTQNVIVGKTKEAINEVLSLIVSDIEEFYSKEPVKYIEYVIKGLKQKDELNIWGRGNPILSANKSIFEYLEAMKDKYEELGGKSIQSFALENITPEEHKNTTNKHILPSELNTEKARKYFDRAIEKGYIKKECGGYKWLYGGKRGQARLGYFCNKVFSSPRPINKLEEIFKVKKLSASITTADCGVKRADVKMWRKEIDDNIFFD